MSIWLGLEISIISFIPIITSKLKINSESLIKYYIIQRLSSRIIIMGIIIISLNINFNIILLTTILIKIGIVPFHNWVISIIEGISYNNIFILLTIIKIAPLNIISYLNINLQTINIIGIILRSISSINQNSIKKILSFSSIYNIRLILTSINNWTIWTTYILWYSISITVIITVCYKLNINFINQIYSNNINLINKTTIWTLIISIGGIPPTITFILKIIIIEQLIKTQQYIVILIIIITSIITIYFYIRVTLITINFFHTLPKWTIIKKKITKTEFIVIIMTRYPIICCLKSIY